MLAGPITSWIDRVKAGDHSAANALWSAYFGQLVQFARARLRGANRRVADEEDAALSAFDSFCAGAASGRFPGVADRDTLWPLLAALTRHKCVDLVRREGRLKRGGNHDRDGSLDDLSAREPPPDAAAQFTDGWHCLLTRLDAGGDADLSAIAVARLDGEAPAEIAMRLGCARRTVERKLALIARLWDFGETA